MSSSRPASSRLSPSPPPDYRDSPAAVGIPAPLPTFAQWLRARDDQWLATLLHARPDVARPAPPDLGSLAGRLVGQVSVRRALDQLDAGLLQILETMLLLPTPILRQELATALLDLPPQELDSSLERLLGLGLVWGDDALQLIEGMRPLLNYPRGLGRPLAELTGSLTADPGVHVRSVPALTADERSLVERLSAGPPQGTLPDGWTEHEDPPGTINRLLRRGLLVRVNDSTVELPREVGLAVRGGAPFGRIRQRPIPVATHVEVSTLNKATAGAILTVLRSVEDLLTALDLDHAGVLRSGGLGVRDHRRLARSAHLDEPTAALLLEVCLAAELIGISHDGEHWLPSRSFDVWLEEPLADRWVTLARAWLGTSRQPGLAGQRDSSGRMLAPLSPDLIRHGAPAARRAALEPLSATRPGTGWSRSDLLELVAWTWPRRGPEFASAVRRALDEAGLLGIVVRDALTGPGRALLADGLDPAGIDPVGIDPVEIDAVRIDDGVGDVGVIDVAQRVGAVLPPLINHILVQPDLSAVAPGPLQPELGRSLALVADVESSGGATVYRISGASLRRPLDAGWSAQDLHSLFATHSRTPVPQTLTYLIDDIARRHGGLRVGAASTYLRSDDDTLIAQVTADRRLAALELRVLAPDVLVSPADPDLVLDTLRAAGYTPAGESAGGAVLTEVSRRQRAPGRRSSLAPRPVELTCEQRETVVRRMRTGDTAAHAQRRSSAVPAIPGVTTATILATLQRAIREDEGLWIGYVNADGQSSQRFIEPITLSGGFLVAYDHRREESRTFAVHRITAVTPADS